MPQFEKFAGLFEAINNRLDKLENQPVGGGPVLSGAIEKSRVGGGATGPAANSPEAKIEMLKSQIANTHDAFTKRSLEEQLSFELIKESQRQIFGFNS